MTRAANRADGAPSVRRNALGLAFAVLALLIPASTAAADTRTDYAPVQSSRSFEPDIGGWAGSVQTDPLCLIPPLAVCPGISNSYQPSGGAGGPTDGFIRTSLLGVLAAIDSTNRGVFTSPEFVYRGDDGEKPTEVSFFLTRRADLNALLVDTGNQATFDVDLIPSTGTPIEVINERPLNGADSFTTIGATEIDPDQLVMGRAYRIRITTSYKTVATLIPNGTADYDNVVLRAATVQGERGPKGERGDRGSRGSSGRNGESKADRELKRQLRKIDIKARRVGNRRVKVTVKCPNQREDKCRFQLRAQLNRFGDRLSRTLRTDVQPGKKKSVRLKLLGGRIDELDGRGRITIRANVTSGEGKTEVFYRPRISNNKGRG